MRDRFVRELIEIARKDKDVVLLTGDLGFGVLQPYWEEFPNQFVNVGIAEQNMLGIAAGLAMNGKKVFVYSIGNFPTLRAIEFIRNDIAYHNANVNIVCVGGGFAYGSAGMSHHATEDIAIMRALPNMVVMTPGDLLEVQEATKAIYNHNGPCYLRLGKGGEKQFHSQINNFEIGKAIEFKNGKDIAILSCGVMMEEAIELAELLEKENINPSLFTFPSVKPIDKCLIEKLAQDNNIILSLEEHNIVGGFGSAIAEIMAEMPNHKARLIRIGLNDEFTSIVGTQKYLRQHYNISADKILKRLKEEKVI
ncbi:MAG: transketolase, alpha subunit [Bacteroidetes bacterium]|nr:transketolase, alpha subunit [Bacteroidota bacterium]